VRYDSYDVVIASYKYARYLTQCLEIVFSQMLKFKEIIVVDDASKDNSRLVLEPNVSA